MDMIMRMVVDQYKNRNPNAYVRNIQTPIDITDLAREVEKLDAENETLRKRIAELEIQLRDMQVIIDNPYLLKIGTNADPHHNDGSNH